MIMALVLQSCEDKPKPVKIKPPKQVIDYEYADALEEEYKRTRYDTILKYLKIKKDARDFWFDLKELKKYIAYVEQEADSLGYKKLGIRIYNGVYPKNKKFADPGISTVFLVPTGIKRTSKASFLPISTLVNGGANISEIPAYNYGQAGDPPTEH